MGEPQQALNNIEPDFLRAGICRYYSSVSEYVGDAAVETPGWPLSARFAVEFFPSVI